LSQADKIVGTSPDIRTVAQAAQSAATQAPKVENNKSLWQYSWNDFKTAISGSLMGFTFGLIGILLIVFSIYMLAKRGGTDSVGAVRQISGV
jgi:hypothetical protein